jgi:predicted RNA binding protein YcfA (HicA-like mRNA interferase family)
LSSSTGLPVISGAEAVRAFKRAGWVEQRQKGSHVSLSKKDVDLILTVPLHKELSVGTLRALIKASGMTIEKFKALL